MQEFFDSIPPQEWRLKDIQFIKRSEEFAITRFKYWIITQNAVINILIHKILDVKRVLSL